MKLCKGLVRGLGAILLFSSLVLVGCGSDGSSSESGTGFDAATSGEPCDVAIVYANKANSGVSPASIVPYVENVAENERFLACVLADGAPSSVSDTFMLTEQNGRRREAEREQKVASVTGMDWSARSAESDVFAALVEADRALGNAPGDVERLLVVVDSGITTTGPIDLADEAAREGLLDPDAFIESLRQNGDLGKFQNIDRVIWYGLGAAGGAQQKPNEGTKLAMQALYRAVFQAAGVSDVEFKEGETVSGSSEGLPEVTPIDLPKIALDADGNPVGLGDTLVFSESDGTRLTFMTATSSFIDEGAAAAELEDGIAQLLSFPSISVTVRGYTDTVGDEATNLALSEERAQTVAALLVSAGVSPDRITAVGMGEDSSYGEGDVAANRRVELMFT